MGKKLSFKNSYAVSEVVGGIILVLIAVVAFSAVYTYLFPPAPDVKVSVVIEASVDSNGNVVLEHKGGVPLDSYKVVVRYADNRTYIGSKEYVDDHWSIGERRYPLVGITGLKLVNESMKVWVGVYSILDDGTEKTVFEGVLHGRVESAQGESSDENPMLISSLRTNTVDEDLICYNYTIQPSINALTYIYNWEVNSNPITNLLMSFDTNSSDIVKDYSGNNNNGTIYGPTWVDYGRVGGAYSFDGIDDYISIPYCFDNDFINEITVETWIKTTASSGVIASFNRDDYWELSLKNGCIQWSTTANSNTVDMIGETTVNDDNWHYIAVSYDYSTGIGVIYVDGRVDTTENIHEAGDRLGSGDSPSGYIGHGVANMESKTIFSTSFETQDEENRWSKNDSRTTWVHHWWEWWEGYSFGRLGSDSLTPKTGSYSLGGCGDFDPDYVAYDREAINITGYTNVEVSVWYSYKNTEDDDDFGFYYWNGSDWTPIFEDLTPGSGGGQHPWTNAVAQIPENLNDLILEFWWSTSESREYMAIDDLQVTGVSSSNPNNFSGLIDEIHIYNRALSSEQIHQNYLCSKDGLSDKSVIVSDETLSGENWKCIVTPNDGTQDDTPMESNSLQIVEYAGGEQ